MEAPIVLTVSDIVKITLSVCGLITAVAAAVGVIVAIVKKAKAPNERQDKRIEELESEMKKQMGLLDNDNKRLKAIEDGNRITQRALLALLSHGIDGNDVDGMRKVKTELQEYLIEK